MCSFLGMWKTLTIFNQFNEAISFRKPSFIGEKWTLYEYLHYSVPTTSLSRHIHTYYTRDVCQMHMLIFICFDKNEIILSFLLCSYHNTICNHFVLCNVWNIAYEICIFVCELVIYIFVVNHIQVYTLTSHFLFIFQQTIVIHKTIGHGMQSFCDIIQYNIQLWYDLIILY